MSFATSCSIPMLWSVHTTLEFAVNVWGRTVVQTPVPAEAIRLFATSGLNTSPPVSIYTAPPFEAVFAWAIHGMSNELTSLEFQLSVQVCPSSVLTIMYPAGDCATTTLAFDGLTATLWIPFEKE